MLAVCGVKRGKHADKDGYEVFDVRAIAGDMENYGGSPTGLDEHVTRLKTSDSISDSKKRGVRIVMNGGRVPLQRGGTEQRAIIEMVCDEEKEGVEGEVDPTGEYVNTPAETGDNARDASRRLRRADEDEGEGDKDKDKDDGPAEHQLLKLDKNATALIFESYGPSVDNGNVVDALRMTWYTKLACEGKRDDEKEGEGGSGGSEHWGFFTWLVLL